MTPDELQDPLDGSPDPVDPSTQVHDDPTIDWEKRAKEYEDRFENYRREADRKATEFSQYQRNVSDLSSGDPSRRAAAAAALGVELVEDEEPEVYDDPYDELRAELQTVKGHLSQRDENLAVERLEAECERRMDKLGLPEDPEDLEEGEWSERAWVLARAVQMPGPDGVPDIARAAKELKRLQENMARKAEQEWVASKKAPRSIAPGQTATGQKNILEMSDEERVAYAVQKLQDMESTV
jgi:hypothetical protein